MKSKSNLERHHRRVISGWGIFREEEFFGEESSKREKSTEEFSWRGIIHNPSPASIEHWKCNATQSSFTELISYNSRYCENSSKIGWSFLSTQITITRKKKLENWFFIRFSTFHIFHISLNTSKKKKIKYLLGKMWIFFKDWGPYTELVSVWIRFAIYFLGLRTLTWTG